MAAFEINGCKYQSKPLDGSVQVIIAKRLSAVLTAIAAEAPMLARRFPQTGQVELEDLASLAEALQPVAEQLSRLSDDDVTYVITSCMSVTERELNVGTGWAPVIQRGVVQDPADATFLSRLQITWRVLQANFTDIGRMIGIATASAAPEGQPQAVGHA